MDEQTTSRNAPPLMDAMPVQHAAPAPEQHYSHKREWKIAAIIVAVAIVLFGIGLYAWKKHRAAVTPEQTLEALDRVSRPDTTTDDQKSATMNALDKNSRPNPFTEEQQLQTLNSLRQ